MIVNLLFLKLLKPRIWKRIYKERLGEPFIYNLISIFVYIFGDFIKKINYDLVPRHPYAFGINEAFKMDCYKVENPYGDGKSSEKILEILENIQIKNLSLQKHFFDCEFL